MYFWSNAINNLKSIKQDIANVIRSKGVDVPVNFKIDELGGYVDQIDAFFDVSRSIIAYKDNNIVSMSYGIDGDMSQITHNTFMSIDNIKIGSNITNISHTFQNWTNFTGNPVCGPNVTNMRSTYYNCYNLTGSPVCGDNVTDIDYTYHECYNLTGSPVCGDKVTNMISTYYNCHNLTGSAICGPNVTNMSNTYYNCYNIAGNAYFFSSDITNVCNCFYGKDNSKRLNLYVKANSTTFNTCLCNNSRSLTGQYVTWENHYDTDGYYNSSNNIYLYPVHDVKQSYLEIEYGNTASPLQSEYTTLDNNTSVLKSNWDYSGTQLNIDNGVLYSFNLNSSVLNHIAVESMEVK